MCIIKPRFESEKRHKKIQNTFYGPSGISFNLGEYGFQEKLLVEEMRVSGGGRASPGQGAVAQVVEKDAVRGDNMPPCFP